VTGTLEAGRDSCPDCGAETGQPHDDGCDVARCLVTGRQRLMCDGLHADEPVPGCYVPLDCGQDAWTGQWPGEAECAEYGWYAYFRAPRSGEQHGAWEPCDPGHPDAVADTTRLILACTWDRGQHRWVRPA
jgi:hypothetical protein